jgi:hypothetical protein
MGEAKRRGTPEQRAELAHQQSHEQERAKASQQASLRPGQLVCGSCRTSFSNFDEIDAPGLGGIEAVFGGQCPNCGNDVLVFKGEPEAVAQAMLAWERMMGADTTLGYQSRDGKHVPFEPEH